MSWQRYATANRRIDDGVEDNRQLLKDLKIDENTLVVFSSDNGASIKLYLLSSFVGGKSTLPVIDLLTGLKGIVGKAVLRMPVIINWPNILHQLK